LEELRGIATAEFVYVRYSSYGVRAAKGNSIIICIAFSVTLVIISVLMYLRVSKRVSCVVMQVKCSGITESMSIDERRVQEVCFKYFVHIV